VDIRVNDKSFYQVDPVLAAVLLELGLVERIEKPKAVPLEPTWGVGTDNKGFACIVHRKANGEMCHFDGWPDDAKDGFKVVAWDAATQSRTLQGPEPPDSVIAAYRKVFIVRDHHKFAKPRTKR